MIKQEIWSGDLRISIESSSDEASGRELYARALTHLIQEADVHGWEKEGIENGGDYRVLDNYCSDVLAALAHSFKGEADLHKSDADPTRDAPQTLRSTLAEIIARLEDADLLDRIITPAGDDDDLSVFPEDDLPN